MWPFKKKSKCEKFGHKYLSIGIVKGSILTVNGKNYYHVYDCNLNTYFLSHEQILNVKLRPCIRCHYCAIEDDFLKTRTLKKTPDLKIVK